VIAPGLRSSVTRSPEHSRLNVGGDGRVRSYSSDRHACGHASWRRRVVVAAAALWPRPAGNTALWRITSPGNAPWVLTLGIQPHGNRRPRGDTIAAFSSRVPRQSTCAKRTCCPGAGLESISDPEHALYTTKPRTCSADGADVLLALSRLADEHGRSVVSGTVALMLQANPR